MGICCAFVFFIVCLLQLFAVIRADTAFQEGFFDQVNLPGGPSDDLQRPNTPFSTDTNRFADGSCDNLAPRFPVYKGAQADVADRLVRHNAYLESCAEQGITPPGTGDYIKEEARLAISKLPNYKDLPAPTKTFPVLASIKWNPSDFSIEEGETYNITVFGDDTGYGAQFWYDGALRVNAQGYESHFDAVSNCHVGMGRCRPHLKKRRRLPTANWMSLACAVGMFVRPLRESVPGSELVHSFLPLDESTVQQTIFAVGKHIQFRARASGQLICFANDAHTLYWNNRGQLDVNVVRTSWPLRDHSGVYQESLLPFCDPDMMYKLNYNNPPCIFYKT